MTIRNSLLDMRRQALEDRDVLEAYAQSASSLYTDVLQDLQDITQDYLALADDALSALGKDAPESMQSR